MTFPLTKALRIASPLRVRFTHAPNDTNARRIRRILLQAILPVAISILVPTVGHAGSATWSLNPTSSDWNTAPNWTPATVPNGSADTATFDFSNTPNVSISANTEVNAITFTSAANDTITVSPGVTLTVSGTGTNGAFTDKSEIVFTNNSVANGSFEIPGGSVIFFDNSVANASFDNSSDCYNSVGSVSFYNSSSANSSSFGIECLETSFHDQSTAGSSSFAGDHGYDIEFFDFSTAGNASIQVYSTGGAFFANSSSAGSASLVLSEAAALQFSDTSTADNATIGATGTIYFYDYSSGGTAQIELDQEAPGSYIGLLDIRGLTSPGLTIGSISGNGVVVLGDKNLTAGSNNLSTTFDGLIDGGGSLTKIGTGTLDLTGAGEDGPSVYTGGTEIEGGRLQVDNTSGSGTGSGPVIVDSGAVLGGGGTIVPDTGAAVINLGTIAPSGQLNVNGNLQLAASSNLLFQIGGTTPATNYDVLNVPALTLNGTLTVTLTNGFTPQQSDTFAIVTTQAPLSGVFNSVDSGGRLNTSDGGGSFNVTYSGLNNVTLSNFGPPSPVKIVVSASPSTGGSVTGGHSYPSGASVTVIATPKAGYTFTNWKQGGSYVVSHSASYTFTASGDRTLVAHFTTSPVTITTSASPANGGMTDGDGTYTSGADITVAATPRIGYAFTNWTENGTIVSHSPSYTFKTSTNRVLVANFTTNPVTIAASASPSGAGTVTGGGTYASGANVTLTASAQSGYSFTNWTENGGVVSTSASYTFTATSNRSLVANFVALIQVVVQTSPSSLTFSVDGTTYSATNTFSWAPGSSHTIATTSPQNSGAGIRYVWNKWSDSGTISHSVAPTNNTTYTATFTKQYFLTMAAGTGGTVSPASVWKNSGSTVSIKATPTNNTQVSYNFTAWTGSGTGSYSGTNNPASITMNGPITETASFTQNPVNVTIQPSIAGPTFSVDGTTYSSTQTFHWPPGSSHTIATTTPQSAGAGVRYVWNNWSDGGTISHTVAPTTNKMYTAKFTTQYFLTMSAGTGGTVTPPSGWKNSGAVVSITAKPSTGYSFTSWSGTGTGSFSGTTNPASITMGGPVSEAASFNH